MRPSSLEHEHEEAICAALQVVIRRFRIRQDAQDDLTQDVWLRILSSPTIIRSFSGKSSLETYLVSVVSNMFRTAEQKRLGRWRASAQARRLGRPAIELERAITRDGVRPSEAIEQHCHNTGASPMMRRELEHVVDTLIRRRAAPPAPAPASDAYASDDLLHSAEARAVADRVATCLRSALSSLDPIEREMLRRLYALNQTVRRLAVEFERPERETYRKVEKLHARLRDLLVSQGIEVVDIHVVLCRVGLDCELFMTAEDGTPAGTRT